MACLGKSVERIGPRPVSSQSALTFSAEHSPPMNSMLGVCPVMYRRTFSACTPVSSERARNVRPSATCSSLRWSGEPVTPPS